MDVKKIIDEIEDYANDAPLYQDIEALYEYLMKISSYMALLPAVKQKVHVEYKEAEYALYCELTADYVKKMGSTIISKQIECAPSYAQLKALYDRVVSTEYVLKSISDNMRTIISAKRSEMERGLDVNNKRTLNG